jgi:hypothetical protein
MSVPSYKYFYYLLDFQKMAYQGYFKPQNPQKYKGDPSNIIYRSGWELKLMSYLDKHQDVIQWQSEEFFIPYRSPVDGRVHRYFPDFLVKKKNPNGIIETVLIEVKPEAQTKPPVKQSKVTKKYINEVFTWGVNEAKWEAADKYCKDRGWTFQIFTEKHLNIKW